MVAGPYANPYANEARAWRLSLGSNQGGHGQAREILENTRLPNAPRKTALPTITGTAKVGATLTGTKARRLEPNLGPRPRLPPPAVTPSPSGPATNPG